MRALDHLRVGRLVDAFADGELDARRARLVGSHLERCWECSGRLELLRLVRAALQVARRRAAEAAGGSTGFRDE